ncbi:MAG: DUF4102 domain-containing protein [Sphingomonadaceae bacterium]|nr:DUF4102 domain-containing protein [Sphingomonadaceae bacterium]
MGQVVGRPKMPLTNLQIKNAKPGVHIDGNGLYLSVSRNGATSWIYRYQLKGRRREMGLGAFHSLPAVEARARAAKLRTLVASGLDPLELREAERKARQEQEHAAETERLRDKRTFQIAAEQFIKTHEAGWSNDKHRQQWTNTLKTYAFPAIGSKPVHGITTTDIAAILEPIWSLKPETASRVRMRIEAVLNSAKALGWRSGENPAAWRGCLDAVLPRASKIKKVKHHAALPWRVAPQFMAALSERDGLGARALEFAILTAARSGEVRGLRWEELDLEQALWVVPAERMKAKREHRVPLSAAAITLLKAMPRIQGIPLVFPGMRNQPLSDMSLSAVLKRMEFGKFTVHGFRSTFRDWAAERGHSFEACEAALAHKIGLKEVKSYLRTDHLEQRREIMAQWARFLYTANAGNS